MFHKLDSTCFYVIREINFQEVDQGNKKRSRHISLKHKMQEKTRITIGDTGVCLFFSNRVISLEWNLAILGH